MEIFGDSVSPLALTNPPAAITSRAGTGRVRPRKMRRRLPDVRLLGRRTDLNWLSVVGCHGNRKDEAKHLIWPRLKRLVVILLETSNLLIFGQRIARHIKAGGCGC